MEATPYAKTSPHATGCLQDGTNGQVIFFTATLRIHALQPKVNCKVTITDKYTYMGFYIDFFLMIVQDRQLGICICLIVTRIANIVTHANLPETLLPGKYSIPLLIVAVSD